MARLPISNVVCTDPGRSIRKIFSFLAGGGPVGKFTTSLERCHSVSDWRSLGMSVFAYTSPEIARMVFCGVYCLSCHWASIARVNESRDSGVVETTAAG